MEEFSIPEPKKYAPDLTPEQKAAMAPLDLLVQYVMPKLLDRQHYLEWAVKKELHEIRWELVDGLMCVSKRISELEKRYESGEKPATAGEKAATRTRKKKEVVVKEESPRDKQAAAVKADISEPVNWSVIADYNPDTDTWVPKVFDGVAVTAPVVDAVVSGDASYPADVVAMVWDLSVDEMKALKAAFPA